MWVGVVDKWVGVEEQWMGVEDWVGVLEVHVKSVFKTAQPAELRFR